MRTIYIDFETTNLNPVDAEPLELSVIFSENFKIKNKFTKLIKFEKKWEELTKTDVSALNFNKIYNQKDLDEHNCKSFKCEIVIKEFIKKIKDFAPNEIIKISGWNAAYYDITILQRLMKRFGFIYYDYFDFFPRDVKSMFIPIYDLYFKDKIERPSLQPVHKYLIGSFKDEDFHNAEKDCIATLDMDKWIYKNIKIKYGN